MVSYDPSCLKAGAVSLIHCRQIGTSLGILLGFACWFAVDKELHNQSAELRWKILSGLPLITTVPLIFTAYMVPESYIFLLKTRRYNKAIESAQSYAPCRTKGYGKLITSHLQMIVETKDQHKFCRDPNGTVQQSDSSSVDRQSESSTAGHERTSNRNGRDPESRWSLFRQLGKDISAALATFRRNWKGDPNNCSHLYHRRSWDFPKRLWKVLADRRCRNAMISSAIPMVLQASCGINSFSFLSSVQVAAVSNQTSNQPWSSASHWAIAFGAVNFVFSFCTLFLTDRFGRTTLVLTGLPVMTVLIAILAAVLGGIGNDYAILNGRTIGSWVVGTGQRTRCVADVPQIMLLFTAIYSFTLGPAAFALPAESFPSSVRESGMALCVSLNMLALGLQILFYPILSSKYSYWTSLVIYVSWLIVRASDGGTKRDRPSLTLPVSCSALCSV